MEQEILGLIAGVKAGRHEDFEVLKAKYRPLVNDMAQGFEESGAGAKSDLCEEAQRALLKAALSFDETKEGITFGLYAKICIRNALITVKRSSDARRKREQRVSSGEGQKKARVLSSLGELEAEELLQRIESVLSDYEKAVLKEYFAKSSARETAMSLGTDERSVNNAVYRIRRKAKKLAPAEPKEKV